MANVRYVSLKKSLAMAAVAVHICPVLALEVREVNTFQVSSSNINVFASPIAWYEGSIYTVNVEPAAWVETGLNLRTVIRKGSKDGKGIWRWQQHILEEATLDDPYHTQASIAIDKNGYVHVAYNMHNMPWQYSVSTRPGDISAFQFRGEPISLIDKVLVKYLNKTPFPSIGTAAIPGNQVTYPAFFYDRQGELYVTYRFATRPKRQFSERGYAAGIAKYDAQARRWEALGGTIQLGEQDADVPGNGYPAAIKAFAYEDHWSVYSLQIGFDEYNNMHVSWLWRKGGAGSTTSHPSYAFSRDGGKHFLRSDGTVYTLPIKVDDADVIVSKRGDGRYYPELNLETDSAGLPYILVHGVGQVRSLVRYRGAGKGWSRQEQLPYGASEFIIDSSGAQWAVATGPIVMRREASDLSWEVLYESPGDVKFGYPSILDISGEDKMLLYTQNPEEGLARIYMIEYADNK